MIPAGKRDRYVAIERETVIGQDELGQDITEWTSWKHAWMAKHEITANERFRANQEVTSETVIWQSEAVSGLTSSDRLSHNGKVYEMQGAPVELERGGGIEITTVAVRV